MTGIQLIVPLEDETETGKSGSSSSQRMDQGAGAPVEDAPTAKGKSRDCTHGKTSSSTVLSEELREQFEAMKAVWRQSKRSDSGEDGTRSGNNALREELKRKERETAVETALAVDEEISRWENGIAELEVMLAAEEDNSIDSDSQDSEGETTDSLQQGVQVPNEDDYDEESECSDEP
ncbi:hypothetical protein IV203_015577 [Nitzschia inconspicua]|uniref:Uncharacterized protein n=1 Tax=Nitzschia inconspicua TaxID=303405 RepID=A0A9K3LBI6_9STRA|nr:hypothetical protein IV203_015577 [Nitzschia inconspicua]